jgi:hypothetical protein
MPSIRKPFILKKKEPSTRNVRDKVKQIKTENHREIESQQQYLGLVGTPAQSKRSLNTLEIEDSQGPASEALRRKKSS